MAAPPEENRMIHGNLIEIGSRGMTMFLKRCLIVPLADDPRAGWP
jgi:hypothetical protein